MDSSQEDSNISFTITSTLIKILKVLVGSSIAFEDIDKINRGVIDIVSGLVVSQNFDDTNSLEQVSIQTDAEGIYTLTTSKINIFSKNIFNLFNNASLINRPREIYIRNLNNFSERFGDAAKFKQFIDCIYDRESSQLLFLRISSIPIREQVKEEISNSLTLVQESSSHSPLPIKVRFVGQFTESQKDAFQIAADRWGQIIQGNLPKVRVHGEVIDGVVINAAGVFLDGEGKQLAQAGPIDLRPHSLLPVTGIMEFDIDDLAQVEREGNLVNLITHEMGHVLGFGSLWKDKGLLRDKGTANPTFIGKNAMREYAKLLGSNIPVPVPVENTGETGVRYGHWRESDFGNELMSSYLGVDLNPISRVTIAAMEDIGYSVSYEIADSFITLKGMQIKARSSDINNDYHQR